jgi:hypothetical protein
MSKRVHRAFLISLCIHVLGLILLTFLLYKNVVYEDENKATIIADIVPPIKPRAILPKFELESFCFFDNRLSKKQDNRILQKNLGNSEKSSNRSPFHPTISTSTSHLSRKKSFRRLVIFKMPRLLSLRTMLSALPRKD